MAAQLIDGKAIATQLRAALKNEIQQRTQQGHRKPNLAVILIGNDPASETYVKNKRLACAEVGIQSHAFTFSESISEKTLLDLINDLNHRDDIDGILVQLPLPPQINSSSIIEAIHPKKDVDGFHPYNLGRLAQFRPVFRPCTPYGIMELLKTLPFNLPGKRAVVVGTSNIVGKPLALELLMAKCTVTVCHSATANLSHYVQQAELLFTAIGKPGIIQSEWIAPGATVIDIGINRVDGNLVGDIDFLSAAQRAEWITPVPGGVGPMTVTMLLKNTLLAQTLSEKK